MQKSNPDTTRYYIARHPDLFRPGQLAIIIDTRLVNGRECFHVIYSDGVQDDSPIENEDFTGKGGAGYFYDLLEVCNDLLKVCNDRAS